MGAVEAQQAYRATLKQFALFLFFSHAQRRFVRTKPHSRAAERASVSIRSYLLPARAVLEMLQNAESYSGSRAVSGTIPVFATWWHHAWWLPELPGELSSREFAACSVAFPTTSA